MSRTQRDIADERRQRVARYLWAETHGDVELHYAPLSEVPEKYLVMATDAIDAVETADGAMAMRRLGV